MRGNETPYGENSPFNHCCKGQPVGSDEAAVVPLSWFRCQSCVFVLWLLRRSLYIAVSMYSHVVSIRVYTKSSFISKLNHISVLSRQVSIPAGGKHNLRNRCLRWHHAFVVAIVSSSIPIAPSENR
jgi:hypothetical protein